MNKYNYYDNLKKYKKNYLQHAKSKLYGIQQDDHQYYKRIGEPGNYRYFYSKDQWDAYQKERAGMTGYEDWKKNQDAKETAKEKADMSGYENWKKKEETKETAKETAKEKADMTGYDSWKKEENKKKDLQESYKQTDSYKQEQAKAQAKEKERIDNVLTKSITTSLKEAIDNDDPDLFIKNIERTNEYKTLKDLSEKIYSEYYKSNEDYPISVRMKNELKKYAEEVQNKYDIKFDNETDNEDMLDYIQECLYDAIIDGRETVNRVINTTKDRDAEIEKSQKKAVVASSLSSDDPKDIIYGVNIELEDYFDYMDQNERVLTTIENKYLNYLTSMSILRDHEERDSSNNLPLIPREMTIDDTMKYVNPGRKSGISDFSGGGNCRLCTLAMDLRMRGYDVSAPSTKNIDEGYSTGDFRERKLDVFGLFEVHMDTELLDSNGLNKMYTTLPKTISDKDPITLKEKVSKEVNSYGCLDVQWKDAGYGHAMFYTVDGDGNIEVYDAQINQKRNIDEILNESYDWLFTRTDNLEPDYDYLREHNWIIYY